MDRIALLDLFRLHEHYKSKKKPTADDKRRLAKVAFAIDVLVDGMVTHTTTPISPKG
jgi:hypothetical protein